MQWLFEPPNWRNIEPPHKPAYYQAYNVSVETLGSMGAQISK